jgi:hypothetical protein
MLFELQEHTWINGLIDSQLFAKSLGTHNLFYPMIHISKTPKHLAYRQKPPAYGYADGDPQHRAANICSIVTYHVVVGIPLYAAALSKPLSPSTKINDILIASETMPMAAYPALARYRQSSRGSLCRGHSRQHIPSMGTCISTCGFLEQWICWKV